MDNRQAQLSALADRIARLQQAVSEAEGKSVSDTDFAKRFLTFSGSTLSRIKARKPDGDPDVEKSKGLNLDNLSEKLTQAEDEIKDSLSSIKSTKDAERQFVSTTLAAATMSSVKRARECKGRRIIVVLAPTGAGKTAIGEAMAAKGATYIEGRQSWKHSYKAFCADVARAAGRPMRTKDYNEHAAEERMLQALRSRDSILYIDEANTFGPESANAIKLMHNQTGTIIVIAMTPSAWETLCDGAEDEVAQLVNRCQPIIRHKSVKESDAMPFINGSGLSQQDLSKCIGMVVEAANKFGAIKTVVGLSAELKMIDTPTCEDVDRIIKYYEKNTANAVITKGSKK